MMILCEFCKNWNFGFSKMSCLFILCFCMFISCPMPDEKPVFVGEDINLGDYKPFSAGNKLAVLPQKAGIEFFENLPRVDGATALYPVYASFVQAVYPATEDYTDLRRGIVKCTTTQNAFANLIDSHVDIIFCAAPSQEQIAMAEEKGIVFNLTPIGKDAFVFFVNKNNPVNNLKVEQIRGIYSGNITNWREVGGRNSEIVAFQRPANSGSQTALEFIMEGIPIMKPPVNREIDAMDMIFESVALYMNLGNAIGFSFLFFTTEMVNNSEIKLLSIEGVFPAKETIQSDEYAFSGLFYAITTGNESENTKKFIEWILSDEGQYLIEKTGYVPIR